MQMVSYRPRLADGQLSAVERKGWPLGEVFAVREVGDGCWQLDHLPTGASIGVFRWRARAEEIAALMADELGETTQSSDAGAIRSHPRYQAVRTAVRKAEVPRSTGSAT